jgi:hypothetical protein
MTLKQSLVCQKKIIRNKYKQLAGGCYLRIVMEPARHACYHTGLGKNGESGKLGQERFEVGWEADLCLFNIVNLNV